MVLHEDEQDLYISLDVVIMERVSGMSLAELRSSPTNKSLPPLQLCAQRECVVIQFAHFIAKGWANRRAASDPQVTACRGKIGRSIRWRLEAMSSHLPRRFRSAAVGILARLDDIVALPWVLTHGDVVPANVMVQSSSDGLVVTGLLDWAEAEYLPFGVGLYGLEGLLGEMGPHGCFEYYSDQRHLRQIFWSYLEQAMPDIELASGASLRRIVEDAHALGVLLWHGIAFDDGRLDRVVEEGRDLAEIRQLDLFFSGRNDYALLCGEENEEPLHTAVGLVSPLSLRQIILGS